MKQRIMARAARLGQIMRKPPVATLLAVVTAIAAVCNGGAMLIDPDSFRRGPEYDLAIHLISPYGWGLAFLGLGLWLGIEVLTGKKAASSMPVVLLCVTYGVMAFMVGVSSFGYHEGSAPVWLYLAMAAYCLITQYALREEDDHAVEETSTDHF